MSLELTITAPFHFSLRAYTGHLSIRCGQGERGIVLESGFGQNPGGKVIEVWRNPHCGGFNVSAIGLHLILSKGVPVLQTV